MKLIRMHIADLEDGAVLGKDLFVKNRILMKKGSTLNTRNITLLRKCHVKFVYIQINEVVQHAEELHDHLLFPEPAQYPDFFNAIVEFISEMRYGRADDEMEEYYRKFKKYSSPFDCFTKICIPIYKILNVMKESGIVDDYRLRVISEKLITLLKEEIINLRKDSDKSEKMILLVEKMNRASFYVQLVEGIFHTKGIYPFLLDTDINKKELVNIANYCNASSIFVIGEEFEPIDCKDRKIELFYINNNNLEIFVNYFAGKADREVDLKQKLKEYKAVKKIMA